MKVPRQTPLRLKADGAVLTITLSRPRTRNAIDEAMLDMLEGACRDIVADQSVGVILFRGEGGFFSSGGDLKERRRVIDEGKREALTERSFREGRLLRTIRDLPQVVVSAVDGGAVGLGLGIVTTSDLVLASRPAVFGAPEVAVGAIPAQIAPFLIRRIGSGHARRLLLSGEMIDADEAFRLGIVHELLPDPGALDLALAARLASLSAISPAAVAATKRLFAVACREDARYPLTAAESYVDFVLANRVAAD